MSPLSSKRRSELRAEAHKLTPVVIIGDKGLTDEVVAEIDRSLKAHELVKVRAATASRENRDTWLESICERLRAHPVQRIGKVLVVYRENPKEKPGPKTPVPGERRREASATTKARVVSEAAREKQRRRDETKRRERDAKEMARKGKLGPGAKLGPRLRGDDPSVDADATRTSRPRPRTPSPLPASGLPRRRPRTSR